jgi:hypothetical protein
MHSDVALRQLLYLVSNQRHLLHLKMVFMLSHHIPAGSAEAVSSPGAATGLLCTRAWHSKSLSAPGFSYGVQEADLAKLLAVAFFGCPLRPF